jgi:chromosome segregation ATPase
VVPEAVAATAPVDVDPLWFARMDGAIRSLRAAVTLAIVLALAAAGVAVWALIKANRANGNSASAQRVSSLNARLGALEHRVSGLNPAQAQAELAKRATTGDVNALRQELRKTQSDVAKISSGNSTSATRAITQVNQRIDGLAQQVAQLQSKGSSTSTTTTTTSH